MYRRIAQLRTAEQFAEHLDRLEIALEFDAGLQTGPASPLGQPYRLPFGELANRFCIQPMEGWDGTLDGKPSELTVRRWERFGASGAALIWGGEAAAVRPEGRANPRQLLINEHNLADLAGLLERLVQAHAARFQGSRPITGLQLTHSGRFCRPDPDGRLKPIIAYHHPLLDRKFNLPAEVHPIPDSEIERLVADFVRAARLAQIAGFDFVDIKHCHGYLAHELLSAVDRPGRYGGSLENRTRFLREVASGIRAEAPGLEIGVRLSAFDFIPFKPGEDGIGTPERWPVGQAYPYAFGGDRSGVGIDLAEPDQLLGLLEELGVRLVNITAGSPYYVPHIQRPALFPPSDGYQPPEDPLAGAARLIRAAAELKARHPGLCIVGTGYSYLQEWLPYVAQNAVRTGKVDCVGIGRMALSYPDACADILAGQPLQNKRLCRTFSDCTSAPRQGLVSGCYPLDPFYKERPEATTLKATKANETNPASH